jgi:hypothetical protein
MQLKLLLFASLVAGAAIEGTTPSTNEDAVKRAGDVAAYSCGGVRTASNTRPGQRLC